MPDTRNTSFDMDNDRRMVKNMNIEPNRVVDTYQLQTNPNIERKLNNDQIKVVNEPSFKISKPYQNSFVFNQPSNIISNSATTNQKPN